MDGRRDSSPSVTCNLLFLCNSWECSSSRFRMAALKSWCRLSDSSGPKTEPSRSPLLCSALRRSCSWMLSFSSCWRDETGRGKHQNIKHQKGVDRSPTLLLTLKDLQKLLDSSFTESTEMCLSVCDESVVCPQKKSHTTSVFHGM